MSSAMEACLVDSINASLKLYMYRNATFLCERLYAESATEANLHLLATCYFRSNQAYRTYYLLKGIKSPQCRYLFALACFEMGNMAEAEAALQPSDSPSEVPNGAAGCYLLGLICRFTDRRQAAIAHYTQALSVDPFFWSAYEDLCLLGVEEDPLSQSQWEVKSQYTYNTPSPSVSQLVTTKSTVAPVHPQRRKFLDEGKLRKVSGRLFTEPPRRSLRLSAESPSTINVCSIPSPVAVSTPTSTASVRVSSNSSVRVSNSRKIISGSAEGPLDDGRRVYESLETLGSDEMSNTSSQQSSPVIDEELRRSVSVGFVSRGSKLGEGATELLALLKVLGEGFKHVCMYESQEALEAFAKLPQNQYETGWVLCQIGRAYFEMVDYAEAERAFSWARRVSPYRLEGTDIYSTVLYHMKKDVELSYLAQEVVSMDRLSPQAWCVIGNCFSLQKDHETALKFFQRALQLDSHFTYAYTLCGHEYVAMEDFEEGLTCYRNAIRMDGRHYNAWYGLGTIYLRQEKYELAEYHFRRALQINERSSVLHCYLGMALHALKRSHEALELLGEAIRADPKNPLPKYQKANVLMSEERYNDALGVLEQLKEVAPRESSVYFLIGKVYKRLGQPESAMYHFCVALDLKPSTADVNLIKNAIEKLHVPDESEEENL
ncbi:cell division cycle protein 27 homolog B [Selaginella moellendorffii]|nr:cell division cycle protein 27 homolog B [Selaginella moellendorffii]|eukprot:XP_002968773.2 cell division cycle protein 27 homolog B [Selaginella moellendorffii]